MANNRSLRKTIAALEKRIEALENQSFAQKLLADDLESKLEQLEQKIQLPNWTLNPGYTGPNINAAPAAPFSTWTTSSTDSCLDPNTGAIKIHHTWPSIGSGTGDVFCTVCGKQLQSGISHQGVQITCGQQQMSKPESNLWPNLPDVTW